MKYAAHFATLSDLIDAIVSESLINGSPSTREQLIREQTAFYNGAGVFNIEDAYKWEIASEYSDTHKDLYGYRGRVDWTLYTIAELQTILNNTYQEVANTIELRDESKRMECPIYRKAKEARVMAEWNASQQTTPNNPFRVLLA